MLRAENRFTIMYFISESSAFARTSQGTGVGNVHYRFVLTPWKAGSSVTIWSVCLLDVTFEQLQFEHRLGHVLGKCPS